MLKIIQLNCWMFHFFDEILDFCTAQDADIINLQEATSGYVLEFSNGQFLEELASKLGMKIIYAPWVGVENDERKVNWFGNAVLTRLEVLDYQIIWDKNNQDSPHFRSHEDHMTIEKLCEVDRNLAYPFVFKEPKNFISTTLKTPAGRILRNLTTHFTVTQMCTETLQTIQQSENITHFLVNSKQLPTIVTGDFNIQRSSASIRNLETALQIVNEDQNTLNPKVHAIFRKNKEHSAGLSIDYILQSGIDVKTCTISQASISDHLAIVMEFEV